MTLFINGRFLTQPLSGVQRYAREMTSALDLLLAQGAAMAGRAEVLLPHTVETPEWQVLRPRVVPGGRGHIWEQTALARAARDGVLLSLGNSGPVTHRAHVLCLHDAHLYEIPHAFSTPYRLWHRALRPVLARRARGLVTVSDHSAKSLSRHLGVPLDRFTVVPNSAEHVQGWPRSDAAPTRYGLKPKGYLLSVGNQSPNKNLEALIAAHDLAGASVPPLALVGGAAPGVAEANRREGHRTLALGRVPDADLRGLYEGAAGFVFASLHEGFGIPPLEAMELGVPVLCARSGAMPDVLGDAPIWFNPRDPADMAAAFHRFARLPGPKRQTMIERGRQVASGYRWEASAKTLLGLIENLPGDQRTPRPASA